MSSDGHREGQRERERERERGRICMSMHCSAIWHHLIICACLKEGGVGTEIEREERSLEWPWGLCFHTNTVGLYVYSSSVYT